MQLAVDALLQRGASERVEVVRLTDEELVVITGDELRPAPRPWYDALPERDHDLARSVALRSMAARGLVEPVLLDDGQVEVRVPVEVQAVLVAQRRAEAVLVVQRRTATTGVGHLLHLLPGGTAIEEHVSSGGLHTLSACPVDLAVDAVVEVLDPFGTALLNGPDREVDPAQLVDVRATSVLAAVVDGRQPQEQRCSVHALDDRVELGRAGPAPGQLLLSQVDRGGLRRVVRRLLALDQG